ncbi:monosaccharide ABC transporter ATP-binding protein, CUT2 family (TC 3.A.1.2.-) [Thermoanaerobacter thermohydrosulfuricus]|uniref:Ribose/galactose/methyl galactoside import ATP-binding protein n=1 Tax=Thermoanaerobacter thermohydrosulfuricus TaxID=1516 RepID=A0A1G7Q3H4_THETY|nr:MULTISPECIES: sugar ABC transporter ATP-binding protein [Thermoanaerobacter]UZQ82373.1 sugar ABC transporter ATP-binding protein [Thermoanaerobacter sp. RKWS2]SDF93015.1 monosaccharide ABC transporter ATP-binding protein, CUT2 family (TC 3.A.1.2.-) [Thermoanaerobacter thermohydrosulfuricus]
MTNNEFILEMNNISKEFPGVKALDNVTLKVRAGTVHAIMGENGAGKSTLMKCLFGIYEPDSGEIILNGKKISIKNSKEALDYGISMIHQELHPVRYRNVMENIWLGRFPMKKYSLFKLVDEKKMYQDTEELLAGLKIDIKPTELVKNLSASKIQYIEIAKAISYNAKIIIMDEPTSSLTENEVTHLFDLIRTLKKEGVSIIYISHKIDEIFEIADEVTIMRDGKVVGTWDTKELTEDKIISKMVGREMTNRFPIRNSKPGEVILKVENLTSPLPKSFKNVSFELRKGEILGIGGLVGSQRTELVEALFGLRSIASGRIFIKGKEVIIRSPIDAKKHGMALLTEERRSTGIFPDLNILENTTIANIKKYVNHFLLLNDRERKDDTKQMVNALKVKTPSLKTLIKDLSGGNQQKVLLARWLLTSPEILILDEPTRGIDVGAKYEIYTIMNELTMQGKSIIMISSEMPELLGMADRIMVMCEGYLSGILDKEEATEEKIMRLASKYTN